MVATDLITAAQEDLKQALALGKAPCVTCSFQAEDMAVVHMVRQLVPQVPVLFLETGYHFPEIYKFRDETTAKYRLNLINVSPQDTVAEHESKFGILYQSKPDQCCKIRKVAPLFAALEKYDVWFTGLRRVQSPTRANLEVFDKFPLPTGKTLHKISLLAQWTDRDVWAYNREQGISNVELYDRGYTSIGCQPCTALPLDPENARSGRWAGRKLECGIHIAPQN